MDNAVLLDIHIKEVCEKASQKLSALFRLANYLEPEERKLIFNFMIKSQFTYCHLVWMFCLVTSNNLMNKTQEYLVGLILNNHKSS